MKKEKYTWRQFDIDVLKLVTKLTRSPDRKYDFKNIYGIPRGGLVLAVILSHKMRLPLIFKEKDITSKTLVVDEVVDSGQTMMNIMVKHRKNPFTATLFWKPNQFYKPNISIRRTTNFIIFPWE